MADIINKGEYRFVSVEGCKELGRGGHGIVYEINDTQVVKVFYDRTTLEMIIAERELGDTAYNSGIRCSKFYDVVETEQGYGIVMDKAGIVPLGTYIHEHPEQMRDYVKRYVEMLHQMHATPVADPRFEDYKGKYRHDIQSLTGSFSKKDIAALLEIVDAIPTRDTMIHGDCHPQNVLRSEDDDLMFIDMADLGYGHHVFDVAGLGLLVSNAKRNPQDAVKILGMDSKECQQMWDYFLRDYYNTDDDNYLEQLNKTFTAFGWVRMATLLASTLLLSKPVRLCMVIIVKWAIVRRKKEVIRMFNSLSAL